MRQRIEAVLNAAKAKGYRVGENPAAWRGHLSHLLPNHQRLSRKHYPSMDYQNVGAFIERLREEDYMSAKALEFTILTAVRSKETFGARWSEIDKASKVWVIPKERMKAAREHRVPLSARAIQILESLKNDESGDYIFCSPEGDKPLSPMSMQKVLIRMGVEGASIHGFRSSFRNWVGNETAFPREVAEAALAHAVGGVEGAYWTSDALEKRRKMMDAWAGYIEPKRAGNILKFSKVVEGGAA
jgi:integrase